MTTKAIEVLCTRWAKMADGGVSMGLRIHFDDAGAVGDMKPNRRYAASFVEIGDDEQPVGVSHSTPMDGGAEPRHAAHAPASDTSRPSTRLVTQAAIACTDSMFRMFLEKTYCNFLPESCGINTEEHAADMVRYICKVKSRKEILVGTPAAVEWNKLYSKYIAWREVPELVS